MKLAPRLGLSSVGVAVVVLVLGTAANAAQKPIQGKLSKRGYTVVALAKNGEVTAVRVSRKRFRVRPPARHATLHLRTLRGVYAGPVVVGRARKGRRAILGITAGAKLGKVKVRRGYARASKRVRPWIDASRWARARKGVPIGARVYGRVRSRLPRRTVRADLDLDGIPQPLDIDDDGDLILDTIDDSPAGRRASTAQAVGCGPNGIYCQAVVSRIGTFFQDTVNANAGSSTAEINDTLRTFGTLHFGVQDAGSIELDCAGHPEQGIVGVEYCSVNGTGTAGIGGGAAGPPFPGQPPPGPPAADPCGLATFDCDHDGFGVLDPTLQPQVCPTGCPGAFFLATGAESARYDSAGNRLPGGIGSGDQFLEHVATDGDTSRCPPPPLETNDACVSSTATLGYVFATVPALVGYSDTAGNAATAAYPVSQSGCPPHICPRGPSGTSGNGFVVAPGPPDGNIRVTLTFWRPQRPAIPGSDPDTAEWMDVGGLSYGVVAGPGGACSQGAFTEDDDQLVEATTPHPFLQGGGGVEDKKLDAESSPGDTSPGRTFTYTLNLTRCLADVGSSFFNGLPLEFMGAPGPGSITSQTLFFRLPSGITVENQTDPAESPTGGTEFQFHLIGNEGGFDFTLRDDGFRTFQFPPGDYTVQALATPGYDPPAIDCDDSDSTGSGNQANFHVAHGEYVTCTFTNTKSP